MGTRKSGIPCLLEENSCLSIVILQSYLQLWGKSSSGACPSIYHCSLGSMHHPVSKRPYISIKKYTQHKPRFYMPSVKTQLITTWAIYPTRTKQLCYSRPWDNMVEAQKTDFTITVIHMFNVLEEDMTGSTFKIYGSTYKQREEMNKTVQDIEWN